MNNLTNDKKVLTLYDSQYIAPRIRFQLQTMVKRKMRVILMRWVRERGSLAPESGWTTVDVTIPGATGRASILCALPQLYLAMYRKAVKLDFDIIQASSLTLLPLALYLSKKSGVPVIYDAYEFYAYNFARHFGPLRKFMQKVLELLENKLVSYADGVLCTDSNNNVVIERYKRINQNSAALFNVPSISDLKKRNNKYKIDRLDRNIPYIAYTGTFNEVTGSSQILKAFEGIRQNHAKAQLLLIGYTFFLNDSSILWQEAQKKGYCTCLPFMPYQTMLQYLKVARMGLVLYQNQPKFELYGPGNSRKLFSYMAAGLPVVASQIPPLIKVIKETRCGILVDESSPGAIAEAVCFLLDHPWEAEKMGARGREAIRQKYNWEKEEPKFWQVYQQALQTH